MTYAIYQSGPIIQIGLTPPTKPSLSAIPPGTYTVELDPERGYYLRQREPLQTPDVIYGRAKVLAKRFIQSFMASPSNLGVILHGDKGSGKTTTLKLLSELLIAMGIPSILVEEAHNGPAFNEFLGRITQPVLVGYDEFDKKFRATMEERNMGESPNSQSSILDLLQGLVPGKKLVVLTANKITSISEFLLNRPGRIRYVVPHRGITNETIQEYARSKLKEPTPDAVMDLIEIARSTEGFSFDMLEAIVEEVNRFGEDPYTAAALMVSKLGSEQMRYIVEVWRGGERVMHDRYEGQAIGSKFFTRRFQLSKDEKPVIVTGNDLVSRDIVNGVFEFKKDDLTVRIFELPEAHVYRHTLRRPSDLSEREQIYAALDAEHGVAEGRSEGTMVPLEEKKTYSGGYGLPMRGSNHPYDMGEPF